MTSKSNKYTLLDKNEGQQYEMIQMVDMDPSKKTSYAQRKQTEKINYVQLQDEPPKSKNAVYPTQSQVQPTKKITNQQPPANQSKGPQAQINYPTYSANPNPNQIQMNGTKFRSQNAPETRKTKIPEMRVACNFCTYEQQVPGNTQVYVCCCCNNMNQCFPLYGLFICGHCQSKVCYPYGTSSMIRCTRCGTVNSVPTEPVKKYATQAPQTKQQPAAQVSKKIQKKQQKLQQSDQRLQRQTDFFGQQLLIEEQDEPPRQKKIQEEQISFDDIPSLDQMQEKQLNYQNDKL